MSGPAPYSKGSRLHGSRSHPHAHFIRFTGDENDRLVRLCRKRGLTMQAFGHAAIMRALNEAYIGKKTDAEIAAENADRPPPDEPSSKGLGIRERLREERDIDDTREPPPPLAQPTPQPVAQPHTSSGDNEILALARTIVETPQASRRDVIQSACRVLARGRSQEDAVRLADELDATIKRLDGVPKTALERVRARAK